MRFSSAYVNIGGDNRTKWGDDTSWEELRTGSCFSLRFFLLYLNMIYAMCKVVVRFVVQVAVPYRIHIAVIANPYISRMHLGIMASCVIRRGHIAALHGDGHEVLQDGGVRVGIWQWIHEVHVVTCTQLITDAHHASLARARCHRTSVVFTCCSSQPLD